MWSRVAARDPMALMPYPAGFRGRSISRRRSAGFIGAVPRGVGLNRASGGTVVLPVAPASLRRDAVLPGPLSARRMR